MNKILINLINTGEVACFIDDVIVRKEKEEKHNKVIKKSKKEVGRK